MNSKLVISQLGSIVDLKPLQIQVISFPGKEWERTARSHAGFTQEYTGKTTTSELTRWSLSPIKQTARSVGTHLLNSFIQFCRVDLGTNTM